MLKPLVPGSPFSASITGVDQFPAVTEPVSPDIEN